jgi:hypothetical protein
MSYEFSNKQMEPQDYSSFIQYKRGNIPALVAMAEGKVLNYFLHHVSKLAVDSPLLHSLPYHDWEDVNSLV